MTEMIVVLDVLTEQTASRLRALLPAGFELAHATDRDELHLKQIIAEADYAISGQAPVSGEVLHAAHKLKLLHKWGVGVDNIDLATAHALGIKVARTTGSNAVAVAEFALGLVLSTLRPIAFGHADLKNGNWRSSDVPTEGLLLSGKTVGIIGFGAIGQALAKLLRGFGCRLLYFKRNPIDEAVASSIGATFSPLPELLQQSDVVVLNCPLTSETAGLIDRQALRSMKKTAVLVNAARGGVVVERDLVDALLAGEIHAAATDVFETEPLPRDSPLLRVKNLVVTPHVAAMVTDTFEKSVAHMLDNIKRVSRGEKLRDADVVS